MQRFVLKEKKKWEKKNPVILYENNPLLLSMVVWTCLFDHIGLTWKEGKMVKYETCSLASSFTFLYHTRAETNELAHLWKPFCMLLPSPLTLILADLPLCVCQFYWYNMCTFISCVLMISTERYLKLIQVKNYFITSEEN